MALMNTEKRQPRILNLIYTFMHAENALTFQNFMNKQ